MKEISELSVFAANTKGSILDCAASELFKNKEIVAPLLQLLVDEFKDLSIEEIIRCFSSDITDDEPIDDIEVDIPSLDPEMKALYEKCIFFDSRFDMRNPKLSEGKLIFKLHFDLEIQNQVYESSLGYPLVKRGIYNMARMLSKQLGRLTPNSDYSKLEKVYGIWICNHNIPTADRNTITSFRIIKENIEGSSSDKLSDYDLINLILVRRGNQAYNNKKGLFDYLNATFSGNIKKMQEYSNVAWSEKVKKEAESMTGLADVYFSWGVDKGVEQGIEQGFSKGQDFERRERIAEMLRCGKSPDAIADFCNYPMDLILEVQQNITIS